MSPRRGQEQATLFELELDDEPVAEEPIAATAPVARVAAARRGATSAVPFRARLFAGLVDLGVHVAVAAVALVGTRLLGITPSAAQLPAFGALLAVFSLFYTVVPLAFWGRTPGMAAVGLVCHAGDDLPLTFAEALKRWLGEVVTVLGLGLPALLALGASRRSLADRWSSSELASG
jgi:RDD family protein